MSGGFGGGGHWGKGLAVGEGIEHVCTELRGRGMREKGPVGEGVEGGGAEGEGIEGGGGGWIRWE